MSRCENNQSSGKSVAQALIDIGPRTVEGDYGRTTMASVDDAIKALEYERKRDKLNSRASTRNVLRTISNHRLTTHDGPAS